MTTREAALLTVIALTGCPPRAESKKIALLLPEAKTSRYETQDRPRFEARVKQLCAECEVLYFNAAQDASKQQSQAEAALTRGAKVLVLDPVDATAARVMAEAAKAQGARVISYDRLIQGTDAVDAYVAFEAETIGRIQAHALLTALAAKTKPRIVMLNGSPTDPNAGLLKRGAHAVFDGEVTVVKEYDTPDWSPDKAQEELTQALTALGSAPPDGVYAANDGTAGGAIAALKAAGVSGVPVTGQDAELAALQRIIAGSQQSTVYKALKLEASTAAELAVHAVRGEALVTQGTADNGTKQVPSVVLQPTIVTRENLQATVLADGFWSREQVCTAAYASACQAAGL